MSQVREAYGQERDWGANSGVVLPYYCIDYADRDAAMQALLAYAPIALATGHYRNEASVKEVGPGTWDGTVTYTPRQSPDGASWQWEFDTSAETVHITQALENIANYAASGTAPDFKGAIGVNADGTVEGVDILSPKFDWTEDWQIPASLVTWSYALTLYALTGQTNSGTFRGFPVKSVLFIGANGRRSSRTPEWVDLTFRFKASPSWSGTLGTIAGISKGPWEYLWVRHEQAEDTTAKKITARPVSAHVERVYDSGDFSALGIGTGLPTS